MKGRVPKLAEWCVGGVLFLALLVALMLQA